MALLVIVCLASGLDIKCRQAKDKASLSCTFNLVADNRTFAQDLPADFRDFAAYVTQMTLGISNLTSIPSDAFEVFPNVRVLVLRCDLQRLSARDLNASKLIFLDAGYNNRLTVLESRLFEGAPTLELIDFGFNEIERIEPNAFGGIGMAQTVYLGGNKLKSVASRTFAGAVNLRKLDLSLNEIALLGSEAFAGLRSLRTLLLNQNRIARLAATIFASLERLERLDLSVNRIASIENGTFDNLERLRFLDVAFNRIKAINEDCFAGTVNLMTLHLSGNLIENFTTESLERLRHFDISFNPIGAFEAISFASSPSIKSLEMRGCNITDIDSTLFEQHGDIELLDVSLNNITEFELSAFEPLKHLQFLKLDTTDIRAFGENFTADFDEYLPSLRFINLAGNTLACRLVHELVDYFQANDIEYEFGERIDVECELLPFRSRALQAYQLSKAEIIDSNDIHQSERIKSDDSNK